ncbi:MAG: hypothetical protein ABEL04_05220 [Salinibacter sp.]|uniref:hypothetical protein n=1 Tax=Salinibacter sp. TaxID=2065818 RepID=UPI0035D4EC99
MSSKRFWFGVFFLWGAGLAIRIALAEKGADFFTLLGESVGQVIACLIPGLLVYGAFRLVRDKEEAPSSRRLAFWGAVLILPLYATAVSGVFTGEPPSTGESSSPDESPSTVTTQERERLVTSFRKSCISKGKKRKEGFDGKRLRRYCDCTAETFGEAVTQSEVDYINEKKSMNASMRKKLNRAARRCRKQIASSSQSSTQRR